MASQDGENGWNTMVFGVVERGSCDARRGHAQEARMRHRIISHWSAIAGPNQQ